MRCANVVFDSFSLGIVFSRCIRVVACEYLVPLMATQSSIVWMYHSLFRHASVSGRLDWFQVLAIMNNAAINISM